MRPNLPRFYHKNILQHLFCHLMIRDLTNTTCKLPEDDVLTPKYVGVIKYKFTVLICTNVGI